MTTIRRARADDLEELTSVDQAAFGPGSSQREPAAPDELARGLESGLVLKAVAPDGAISGYVQGVEVGHHRWFVEAVAVSPAHAGRGTGSALVAAFLERIDDEGGSEMRAETVTSPENASMVRLLLRRGFRAQRLIADYYGPGSDRLYFVRDPAGRAGRDATLVVPCDSIGALASVLGDGYELVGYVDAHVGCFDLHRRDPAVTMRS